jgi:hypothetical protein
MPNEPIRPLQDVWLRPRRVFRELAAQPIGLVDHLLGAAQGMVSAVAGIAGMHLMALVYARLGSRVGRATTRRQAVHVLAYGAVPMTASLGIWVLTALIAGEVTFVQAPKDVDDFLNLLLRMQFLSYVLLLMWSVLLQVMGFSEILAVSIGKAFGIWVLGQGVAALTLLFVYVLLATLIGS